MLERNRVIYNFIIKSVSYHKILSKLSININQAEKTNLKFKLY